MEDNVFMGEALCDEDLYSGVAVKTLADIGNRARSFEGGPVLQYTQSRPDNVVMESDMLRVVVADDEDLNLEILVRAITDAGHEAYSFEDGDTALQYIQSHPDNVDIIILDKMMPRMNGLEVLKSLKADAALKNIPVILQTGDVGIAQLKQGLEAGAYYYLSKPFYPEMLLSLIAAAARDCVKSNRILNQLKKETPITSILKAGVFEIKTVEEAYKLAAAFSYHATNPEEVNLAISGLLINAIEHGNLGISYEEKNSFLRSNTLPEEIKHRLALPQNINKFVKITFEKIDNKVVILIEDQGEGFDWKKYMNYDPIRLTDLNGRGIASANLMKVRIEYRGNGNKVKCQFDMSEGV